MNNIELLKLIKKKLFEPRKKIVQDGGVKAIADSQNWVKERQFIDHSDISFLEESDGWNVADKDYVDYKITELQHKINYTPSAPPSVQPSVQPSVNKSIIFSSGVFDTDTMTFFSPGIVLKKGWIISEVTIFNEVPFEDEIILSIKNITDTKSTQISKIKPNKQQILSAEAKYKVDSNRAVVFSIKTANKLKLNLQLTIEHN